MPTQTYQELFKRNGLTRNYNVVLRQDMILSSLAVIDTKKLLQVKNFGQALSSIKNEVYFATQLDSKSTFACETIPVSPTYINGTIVRENRAGVYLIPIENILLIEPFNQRPFVASPSVIWVQGEDVRSAIPTSYRVDYSVADLWFYILHCHFPNPYYYENEALGGDTFLNL